MGIELTPQELEIIGNGYYYGGMGYDYSLISYGSSDNSVNSKEYDRKRGTILEELGGISDTSTLEYLKGLTRDQFHSIAVNTEQYQAFMRAAFQDKTAVHIMEERKPSGCLPLILTIGGVTTVFIALTTIIYNKLQENTSQEQYTIPDMNITTEVNQTNGGLELMINKEGNSTLTLSK